VPYHGFHRKYLNGQSVLANSASEPGDGQEGGWPRDRLLAMDMKFCERVERAMAAGDESPRGAAGLAKCARVTEIKMNCDQRAYAAKT
jgi:hypothetical protein